MTVGKDPSNYQAYGLLVIAFTDAFILPAPVQPAPAHRRGHTCGAPGTHLWCAKHMQPTCTGGPSAGSLEGKSPQTEDAVPLGWSRVEEWGRGQNLARFLTLSPY